MDVNSIIGFSDISPELYAYDHRNNIVQVDGLAVQQLTKNEWDKVLQTPDFKTITKWTRDEMCNTSIFTIGDHNGECICNLIRLCRLNQWLDQI